MLLQFHFHTANSVATPMQITIFPLPHSQLQYIPTPIP